MFNKENVPGLYAPRYYREFQCIADRCRHSCCIDWEICIDDATYEKYKQIESIRTTVKECEDGSCFSLCEDGRCPHLNEKGLCNIILSHGEDYLSEICQNHPRFYNDINGSRIEAGLGIVCEEACRLILTDEASFSLSKIEDLDGDADGEYVADFDPLLQRARIISVIEAGGTFDEKINALKTEFSIPEPYSADEWLERFLALEILDADWKTDLQGMVGKLFRRTSGDTVPYEKYYARLLTYFVYRHVSLADSAENLRARLAFCILSVEMIRSLFEADPSQTLEGLIDWARRYSGEIEYSEDNTEELIFAFACALL